MKKNNIKRSQRTTLLSMAMFILTLCPLAAMAQTTKMKVTMTNGETLLMPVDSISDISVRAVVPEALSQLAGQWVLVASANGTTDQYGISHAVTDSIPFTATVASDGLGLVCRADNFYNRSGNVYPAQWRMLMEEDNTGKIRIGWALDETQPASEKEFDEPKENYLENGFFYYGKPTDEHHYIYLLSMNIATQRLEGMTLWSGWMNKSQKEFIFPQNQQVYGTVATTIPYQGSALAGYFEIWASPRFVKQ